MGSTCNPVLSILVLYNALAQFQLTTNETQLDIIKKNFMVPFYGWGSTA